MNGHTLRRTDIRFASLLSHLPPQYTTLNEALSDVRSKGISMVTEELHQDLSTLDNQLMALNRVPLERELLEGIRPVLRSDKDAACLELLMGWVDGQVTAPEEVAAEFGVTANEVLEIEAHVKREIAVQGLMVIKLERVLEKAQRTAPVHGGRVTQYLHEIGASKLTWDVRTFIAAVDLLGLKTPLNLMQIGDIEYLTLLADESYPTRVVDHATHLIATRGSATVTEVAEHVAAQIGQAVTPKDARIVVAQMDWVGFTSETRETFERRQKRRRS